MAIGANHMLLQRPLLRRITLSISAIALFCALMFTWAALQNRESTLAIRPASQNVSVPDGFSIWHHLDANGIHFKSITPQDDDTLLIKFDSRAQSAAAKAVLDRTLPQGYIIAAQDDEDSQTSAWLNRLRNSTHRFG